MSKKMYVDVTVDHVEGHTSEVSYGTADDGIWLSCECGWEENQSFVPSLDKLINAWYAHLRTVPSG